MAECAFMVQVTIGHFSYFLSESCIFSTTCTTMEWASQRLALGCLRPADWYRLLQEATTILEYIVHISSRLLSYHDCRRVPVQWILKRNPEIGNPGMTRKICC